MFVKNLITFAELFEQIRMSLPFNQFLMVDPSKCSIFKDFDLKYWSHPDFFKDFISNSFDLEGITNQLQLKKSTYNKRVEFANIVKNQYSKIEVNSEFTIQIESLFSENTFAVVCAHQPILLGGPVYWWYKIIHAISLSNYLNELHKDFHFVPIYFIGSEDHDFEELNHINLFNQRIEWNGKSDIAIGKKTTSGLHEVLKNIRSLFSNQLDVLEIIDQWDQLVNESDQYGEFYFNFVHSIFKSYGLLCFNPDDQTAKNHLKSIFKDEILHQSGLKSVTKTNQELQNISIKAQAHAREINLFYHGNESRTRIIKEGNNYTLADQSKSWTEQNLLEEIENSPQNFSPNVILRPIYQELLLPTVVFIGGGAEMNYWLQLGDLFKHHQISFPILARRFSAILFSKTVLSKIKKLKLSPLDFLENIENIKNNFVSQNSNVIQEIDLIKSHYANFLKELEEITTKVSKSELAGTKAEINKLNLGMEKLIQKMSKDYKNTFDTELQNIQKIKNQLFPNNQLQEREESGLSYYLKYQNTFIDSLLALNYSQLTAFYLIYETN
ncbi:MAG: bacillithiol biosynthesis cysteine-adding enzyme BshC [Saprospiraceae bacterium]|nr:bacillithiol biosynthesis cysteine-adding enzyme BshC [Saprospiraceae bacterium]MBK7812223.1 bacillithiol biosynthesis cysteine-adding enzyme BshC [Saprospiraceae bacterium]MBK9632557.1 bacillithiol biosynthesis cysteine-adding enzyme BshC [Saprospiraceae bacterium]